MLLKKAETENKNEFVKEVYKKAPEHFWEYASEFDDGEQRNSDYLAEYAIYGVLETLKEKNPDKYEKMRKEFGAKDLEDFSYKLTGFKEFRDLEIDATAYLCGR